MTYIKNAKSAKSLLTTTPKLWSVECKYCLSSAAPDKNQHELELSEKASRLCQRPNESHIQDYLAAEFLRLDHSILTSANQIQILMEVHNKTGCTCITDLITSHATPNSESDTTETNSNDGPKEYTLTVLPPATARHARKPKPNTSNTHAPTKPTTLLERLRKS